MTDVYYAVIKTGAAQNCFDNPDPAKALAKAIEYVEERIGYIDWRERDVQEVVEENGASVFAWTKGPVTVTVERLTRKLGPYQHGVEVAKWVGGKRTEVKP